MAERQKFLMKNDC